MTDAMRQEVGGFGIRVCIINPGATATEVFENVSDPEMRKTMQSHVTKDGAMAASDVADAILFVASLPPRANISELSIRPTIDTTA
jgi:NADP-dependent 3-hydroxy acid dehydrogenase YdfG